MKTTCPCRVPLGNAAAGIRTRDLLIASKAPVGATATTSRRQGRPVIDGGSRGAVGVATGRRVELCGCWEGRHLRMRV